MPQAAQHPRPVVRGATRLEPDSRRRQLGKEFLYLAASDLPPQHRLLVLVNPMNLKDMFGRIQTNSDNRHSDGSFSCVVTTPQPGTFDAVGGRPPQHRAPTCPVGASIEALLWGKAEDRTSARRTPRR